jgi:hypothetical protein
MNRRPRVALAFLALSSLVPLYVSAETVAPVLVSDSRGGIASIELVEIAAYKVTLRNTSSITADEIRLAIPYGRRKTATFDVHGTFEPGVDMQKSLRKTVGGGLYANESEQNTCIVQYVHFTDGTSWDKPEPKN